MTPLLDRTLTNEVGCMEWIGAKHRDGYGFVRWHGRTMLAHRAVYEQHVGLIPSGQLVCHSCDNPPCINPDHLFLGTNADNNADMRTKGRDRPPRGERHGRAVVTESVVRHMRDAHQEGESIASIARRLGVSHGTTSNIIHHRHWRHIA